MALISSVKNTSFQQQQKADNLKNCYSILHTIWNSAAKALQESGHFRSSAPQQRHKWQARDGKTNGHHQQHWTTTEYNWAHWAIEFIANSICNLPALQLPSGAISFFRASNLQVPGNQCYDSEEWENGWSPTTRVPINNSHLCFCLSVQCKNYGWNGIWAN